MNTLLDVKPIWSDVNIGINWTSDLMDLGVLELMYLYVKNELLFETCMEHHICFLIFAPESVFKCLVQYKFPVLLTKL